MAREDVDHEKHPKGKKKAEQKQRETQKEKMCMKIFVSDSFDRLCSPSDLGSRD